MTTDTRTLTGRHGIRRPRAVGILAAAVVIVLATYAVGNVRLPSAAPLRNGANGAAGDPQTERVAGPAPALAPPGAGAGLIPGSIDQLTHAIAIWSANVAKEP